MYWLISYRVRTLFKQPDGGVRGVTPRDVVAPTDRSLAQFIIESRLDVLALGETPYDERKQPARADDIQRVYSAVEIDKAEYKTLCEII